MDPKSDQDRLDDFSDEERQRYSRHFLLPEVGVGGQEKLRRARVLCVGAGGLGSPLALYLSAAGVGTLGLVDFDRVDTTNLHRQVLYGTNDVGRLKLDAARERIESMNPHVTVVPHAARLTAANALEILRDYDVVADGTDNFGARYLVNDASVVLGKPNVYASVYRFEGQVSVFWAGHGPCYRCLYPDPPEPGLVPSCAEGGVLGVLPGLVGLIQATEVLKLLLRIGEPLIGRLLLVDALGMKFREVRLRRNPDCRRCGAGADPLLRDEAEELCAVPSEAVPTITGSELMRRLALPAPPVLIDVREPHEVARGRLPNALTFPLGTLDQRLELLPRSREIVVYCQSGMRSARATVHLLNGGFPNVRNLTGGMELWIRSGGEVVSEPE
jgi:molybdopterin/thiamine biosynthesis adenylyltransferase/rhodanese-related sulfurtransferase